MTKTPNMTLVIICLLLLVTKSALAMDISLAWDPSPESNVTGYKVYYKANSASLPFNGVEAGEGASPIDVGNTTTFSFAGLPDGKVYYFAVNAYNNTGAESIFSNIVASAWVPGLIAPANGNLILTSSATFVWETAPASYNVTYTLYYGTDPELKAIGSPTYAGGQKIEPKQELFLTLLILAGFILLLGRMPRKKIVSGAVALALGAVLTACGGGGGSGETGSPGTQIPAGGSATVVVPNLTSDYFEAFDLTPSTTYYWKVVAVDMNNPNLRYESVTSSISTANY